MNIQPISNNYKYSKRANFGNNLAEQLGLDVHVKQAVDAYMPEIKEGIRKFVQDEIRISAKDTIKDEIKDALDIFSVNTLENKVNKAINAYDRATRIRNVCDNNDLDNINKIVKINHIFDFEIDWFFVAFFLKNIQALREDKMMHHVPVFYETSKSLGRLLDYLTTGDLDELKDLD